jgi:hypothetical protein
MRVHSEVLRRYLAYLVSTRHEPQQRGWRRSLIKALVASIRTLEAN